MAVVIRLSQGGSKKKPFFNIVVTDKAKRRDGGYLAKLGNYNPRATDANEKLKYDAEALKKWIAAGALCSDTVRTLLRDDVRA